MSVALSPVTVLALCLAPYVSQPPEQFARQKSDTSGVQRTIHITFHHHLTKSTRALCEETLSKSTDFGFAQRIGAKVE